MKYEQPKSLGAPTSGGYKNARWLVLLVRVLIVRATHARDKGRGFTVYGWPLLQLVRHAITVAKGTYQTCETFTLRDGQAY